MKKHEVLLWGGFISIVVAIGLKDGLVPSLAVGGLMMLIAGVAAWIDD